MCVCFSLHVYSELAGLLLIDPAPETLFDVAPSTLQGQPDNKELETLWYQHWYRGTVPHLQSVHVSGSLGFNRLGLMVGLMSAVEVPELRNILTDDVIAIKVTQPQLHEHYVHSTLTHILF